ncbi:MAG: hypothetical protein RLP44_05670 [Aggregatilineales bacterium]
MMFRKTLGWGIPGIIMAVVLGSPAYLRDIRLAYQRVSRKSKVITSPFDDIC